MEQTDQQLSITQTGTGYWSVQRGPVQLSGAMTRKGAEAERDLLRRLAHARSARSTGIRTRRAPRAGAFSG